MSKPSLESLKKQAKSLRQNMADIDKTLSHSQSLELIAKQYGFKDWNTIHAHIGNQPVINFEVGGRITGRYLGQKISGILVRVTPLDNKIRFGITVKFDEAVDVISFKGMSNWRNQVQLIINKNGETTEKTSNGLPHLAIDMV